MTDDLALVFDTETTGLIQNHTIRVERQPEVVEFYGCIFDLTTGDVKKDLHLFIKPTRGIPPETTAIHRITDEMVENELPFSKVADKIGGMIASTTMVIAHNLSYDMEMINIEFERLGRKAPWPPRKICTVEATVHLRGYRLNMQGLYKYLFNEEFVDAHRADIDVQALVRCCYELRRREII